MTISMKSLQSFVIEAKNSKKEAKIYLNNIDEPSIISEGILDWFASLWHKVSNKIAEYKRNSHNKAPQLKFNMNELKKTNEPIKKLNKTIIDELTNENSGFKQLGHLLKNVGNEERNNLQNKCTYITYTYDVGEGNPWIGNLNIPVCIIGWYNTQDHNSNNLKLCIFEVSEYAKVQPKQFLQLFKQYCDTENMKGIETLSIDLEELKLENKFKQQYIKLGFEYILSNDKSLYTVKL